MGIAAPFGRLLRESRQSRRQTIEELAEASGVSGRAIGDMERGRSRRPHRGTITALAQGLDLGEAARAGLLGAARAARPGAKPAGFVKTSPHTLPRGVRDFVGRHAELTVLRALAQEPADSGPALGRAVPAGPWCPARQEAARRHRRFGWPRNWRRPALTGRSWWTCGAWTSGLSRRSRPCPAAGLVGRGGRRAGPPHRRGAARPLPRDHRRAPRGPGAGQRGQRGPGQAAAAARGAAAHGGDEPPYARRSGGSAARRTRCAEPAGVRFPAACRRGRRAGSSGDGPAEAS